MIKNKSDSNFILHNILNPQKQGQGVEQQDQMLQQLIDYKIR